MQPEKKPNILEDSKYALFGKRAEGSKSAPKLFFSVFKGNVSANCFPNHPQASVKSIRLGMSGDLWKLFIQTVNVVLEHKGQIQEHVKVSTGKINDMKEAGTLVVCKNEEGEVYLALKAPGLPQPIKFSLLPTNYLTIFNSDGSPLSDAEKSVRYARGYFEIIDYFVTKQIEESWEPYKPQGGGGNWGGKKSGGGNWGGGGNQGGGNWGGQQQSGGGGFDDIPL